MAFFVQTSLSRAQISTIDSAKQAMAAKNYDAAIDLYRQHLRLNKNDYDAWAQLGAAYYHTGLPKRALRYLKTSVKRSSLRSFNFYYQALSYAALDSQQKSVGYYELASAYQDTYGGRAMFELGVTYYNQEDGVRARHWLNLYLQRHPNAPQRDVAIRLIKNIDEKRFIPLTDGNDRPNMENSLYRYNKLSLFPSPHYWFAQVGGLFDYKESMEVQDKGAPVSQASLQQAILVNAGIGVGPYRDGKSTIFGGYTYRQNWFTDPERLETYLEDPLDIEYQPFRPDLLERRHQVYGDFRRLIFADLYLGLFGRIEFARSGSQLILVQEDENIPLRTVKIADTTLLIPWIGYAWTSQMRTLGYFYFRKQVNEDAPDFSNKTYSFLDGEDSPPISLGLSHSMSFPEERLEVNLEIFRYEFIYNDVWQDYTRLGALLALEFQLIPTIQLRALGGYYMDDYIHDWPRIGSCSSIKPTDGSLSEGADVSRCIRQDEGILGQVGASWNYSQFHRISADLVYVVNENPYQTEFDESKVTATVTLSIAFPSIKRVFRYIDRFGDSAFTKDPE
jgi:tetratricopeptide (TPR) repeat protein